jgi:hypothetical protein
MRRVTWIDEEPYSRFMVTSKAAIATPRFGMKLFSIRRRNANANASVPTPPATP